MLTLEWIATGGMLAVVGFAIKTYVDVNEKVSRAYKRLDEVKEKTEETFTRKDICMVLHKQIDGKLDKMDCKLDRILENGKGS